VVDPVTGEDDFVRLSAVGALVRRDFPETLLTLARKIRTLSPSMLGVATVPAEALMIRHYRRIDPADQPEVLAAMGWLTMAALSGRSA
jgi:hypothetical protein